MLQFAHQNDQKIGKNCCLVWWVNFWCNIQRVESEFGVNINITPMFIPLWQQCITVMTVSSRIKPREPKSPGIGFLNMTVYWCCVTKDLGNICASLIYYLSTVKLNCPLWDKYFLNLVPCNNSAASFFYRTLLIE